MLLEALRHQEKRVDVFLSDLCSFKRETSDETKTSWQWGKSKRTYRTQLQKGQAASGVSERKRCRLLEVKGTKVTKQTVNSWISKDGKAGSEAGESFQRPEKIRGEFRALHTGLLFLNKIRFHISPLPPSPERTAFHTCSVGKSSDSFRYPQSVFLFRNSEFPLEVEHRL